jgi:hypothetical protein
MQQDIVGIQHFVLIPKSCAQIDVSDLFLVYTCTIVAKNVNIAIGTPNRSILCSHNFTLSNN